MLKRISLALIITLIPFFAAASEPVKHIGAYVLPYYASAKTPEGTPRVAVAKDYDSLLSSNIKSDIVKARDAIQQNNPFITPMTLMVLAIRLYDMGLRDDAVFWFYAAKDRYVTLSDVLDMRSPALSQVTQATRDFATLAGPIFNGYAFCDINKQKQLRAKALEWVVNNPYQAIFIPQLPAKPGDRQANLDAAVAQLRDNLKKEAEYLSQPENLTMLTSTRKKNKVDAMFCW